MTEKGKNTRPSTCVLEICLRETKPGLCSFWFQLSRTLGIDADEFSAAALVFKLNEALDQSEQGIILAAADIITGLPLCAALTCQDIAAQNALTTEFLQTEPLCIRISAVP
jgi:hypothetical protein